MRRQYRTAKAAAFGEGHQVLLDDKLLQTPAKLPMLLPSLALAEAIAAEWAAQCERVEPASMPMMQLAATAIDRVRPRRHAVIAEIAAYAGTDLLCYRAEGPLELIERQEQVWQPLLDWLHHRYDAHLQVTSSIVAAPQSKASLLTLQAAVAGEDDLVLTGLRALTAGLGSLVLALAVLEGRLEPDAAYAASQLDETFQIERWGEDAEAMARREALRQDILAAARFIDLARRR